MKLPPLQPKLNELFINKIKKAQRITETKKVFFIINTNNKQYSSNVYISLSDIALTLQSLYAQSVGIAVPKITRFMINNVLITDANINLQVNQIIGDKLLSIFAPITTLPTEIKTNVIVSLYNPNNLNNFNQHGETLSLNINVNKPIASIGDMLYPIYSNKLHNQQYITKYIIGNQNIPSNIRIKYLPITIYSITVEYQIITKPASSFLKIKTKN